MRYRRPWSEVFVEASLWLVAALAGVLIWSAFVFSLSL